MDFFEIMLQQKLAGGGGGDYDAEDRIVTGTISIYTNSRVTNIGDNAFRSCSALTTVNFPNVTSIGSYAFTSCFALTAVSFPNATYIGSYAFQTCSALIAASFPNVTGMGNYTFQNCATLTTANFPKATNIASSAFYGCRSLMSAYFLASSTATLGNASAFHNTPMSNSTYTGSFGSIYVPASLVDAYKSAAWWSAYKNRITSYEGE